MNGIDWSALGFWILIAMSGGLLIFHGVAGYYHLHYYVLRSDDPEGWKCQAERKLPPRLQRQAVKLSTFNLAVGGALTGILIYAITEGLPVPIYLDVTEYGWTYTILSTVLLFVIEDAIAYYVHRGLHHRFFYKRFHRSHHRFVATTPYVTAAIHPAVFVVLQVASFLPLFLIPFHVASIAVVFIYILIFNVIDHSGVSLKSRIPWQASSNYHDDHHVHFHVNFGQHLMIWDKLHGTLRRQGRKYGKEVFGGRGHPSADEGSAPAEHVEY
jgi:lathosterol oxidase